MSPCVIGLDRLFQDSLHPYRGARAGVIANPASVDSRYVHAVDRFAACRDLKLAAVFGPQHGAKSDRQDNMIESPDEVDPLLGIPVYSLYGEHRKPTPAMLDHIDVLFCDLVDVGTRAFTFLWTALLAMEACAASGKRFVVLDRPNPIGGTGVEGHLLDPSLISFIGMHPIPMRHGMTIGELAMLLNRERALGADLDVIEVRGWRREDWADRTGVPWVMPSPNMPAVYTATVYPGTVLIEGTNLSEGRGTTRPFEIIGAPYLDAAAFAGELNALRLPGVHFRPAWFRPTFDKWAEQLCGGVQVHVIDREEFLPYATGLAILRIARELGGPAFEWRQPPFEYEYEKMPIDLLSGTTAVRQGLDSPPDLTDFLARRGAFLRY